MHTETTSFCISLHLRVKIIKEIIGQLNQSPSACTASAYLKCFSAAAGLKNWSSKKQNKKKTYFKLLYMLRLATALQCLPSLLNKQSRIYVAQQKCVTTSSASVQKYGLFFSPKRATYVKYLFILMVNCL